MLPVLRQTRQNFPATLRTNPYISVTIRTPLKTCLLFDGSPLPPLSVAVARQKADPF